MTRSRAAYGGIYIAASLFLVVGCEGPAADKTDLMGAVLAVLGAAVIIGFAERAR